MIISNNGLLSSLYRHDFYLIVIVDDSREFSLGNVMFLLF